MSQQSKPPDTTPLGTAHQYRQDLALFRTVISVVNSSPELDHVLRLTLRTVLQALGPEFAGMVLLRERQHPGLAVIAHQGVWEEAAPRRVFVHNFVLFGVVLGGKRCSKPTPGRLSPSTTTALRFPGSWRLLPNERVLELVALHHELH